MDKVGLRADMKKTIKNISPDDQIQQNNIIFTIRQTQLFPKYKNRAVYISLTDEVDTKSIIDLIQKSGLKCFLPMQQGDIFFFTEITPNTQYQKDTYGLSKPIIQEKSNHIPDAILVPGLAFTTQGSRLGRGLGRYDKLLAQYPNMAKIGVGYTQQIQENIPTQAHDQNMDMILSTQLYFTS